MNVAMHHITVTTTIFRTLKCNNSGHTVTGQEDTACTVKRLLRSFPHIQVVGSKNTDDRTPTFALLEARDTHTHTRDVREHNPRGKLRPPT